MYTALYYLIFYTAILTACRPASLTLLWYVFLELVAPVVFPLDQTFDARSRRRRDVRRVVAQHLVRRRDAEEDT